jgi:hypothetical protein
VGLCDADLTYLQNAPDADYLCRWAGRDAIPDYDFFLVFNLFRLAAIFHRIKGRVIRGTASSLQAVERGSAFTEFARFAVQYLSRGDLNAWHR